MKSVNLFWYKIPDGSSNFGDELNFFLVKELSGKNVKHIPYPYKWYKVILFYLRNLIKKNGYISFKGMINSLFAKQVLFVIGSVLHIYDRNGVIVWGAGIIKENSKVHNADFKAVRGLETVRRLKDLGYNPPKVLGDPALLLPLIIKPIQKKHKIGIVPNYKHFDELNQHLNLPPEFVLIDLKDEVYTVTNEMTSCEYILATSLHGLIVAHAYNIPALWVDLNLKNKLAGDDIKFKDYFSSVNIEPYQPLVIETLDFELIRSLIEDNKDKVKINNNLAIIQKNLLESFPFSLKNKYKEILNIS